MKTLPELERLTVQWAHGRGILQNGKATTQGLKLISEAGELAGNLADMEDIRDDIGDCLVVLCNICGLTNSHNLTYHNYKEFTTEPLWAHLGNLSDNIIKNRPLDKEIGYIMSALHQYAETFGTTLEECWEIAYDDIKDRRGFLNEHGNFVKEADENYEQLLMDFQCKTEPTIDHLAVSMTDEGTFNLFILLSNGDVENIHFAIDDSDEFDVSFLKGHTLAQAREYIDGKGDVL